MAVVYLHKRNDTNEVFYVGIGADKKRAFQKIGRNKYWKHIVNKIGYTVDLLVSDTPWEDACKIEKLLIEKYGRKDFGLGNLVNLTDGGEGTLGGKFNLGKKASEETKQKMSKTRKGKTPSIETRQKMSEWQIGKTFSDETRQKISEALKGHIPWNKGVPMSEEQKQKLRKPKNKKSKI